MRQWLAVSVLLLGLTTASYAAIPNTVGWFSLTGTTVDAACQFPGQWGGCAMLTNDWNGALFDTTRNRMVFGWGGGHSDYFGNEIVALSIGTTSAVTDTQTMTRIRNSSPTPTSYTGNAAVTDSTSSIGISPVARHTYSNLAYLPEQDKYLLLGGGSSPAGNMTNDVWLWAPATNIYQQLANSPIDRNGGFFGSAPAWDGERHLLWVISNDSYYSFNPATNAWTARGAGHGGVDMANYQGAYDAVKRRHYIAGDGGLYYWDTRTTSTFVRTQPTLTSCAGAFAGSTGLQYDPVQDRIVAWHGGNTIYLLNTTTHTCTTQVVAGGPAEVGNGTYSRFQYSVKDNLYVTCQASSSNCYALRLSVQSADTDWLRRKNAPGVTNSEDFDTIGDYTNGVQYFVGDGGYDGADLDTTIKTSGTGALRFTLPAGRATSNISGDFRVCLRAPCAINGNDTTAPGFGFPSDFWLSWRIRISPTMVTNLANYWRAGGQRTGWKSVNMHNGAQGSCGALEITKTIDTSFNNNTQIWYKECSPGITTDGNSNGNGGSPYFQQGNNTRATTNNGFWCDWNSSGTAGTGTGVGCFNWQWQNEWITFIEHYQIGANGAATSQLDAWIYRDGSATALQIQNVNGEPFGYGSNPVGQRTYNQVSFVPYMTGLSTSAPVDAFIWIDEFIASTNQIDAPGQIAGGGPAPDTTPPSAPTGVTVN